MFLFSFNFFNVGSHSSEIDFICKIRKEGSSDYYVITRTYY
nr:MAG TPA: hypothetical protein [Bacteriophage sp.]